MELVHLYLIDRLALQTQHFDKKIQSKTTSTRSRHPIPVTREPRFIHQQYSYSPSNPTQKLQQSTSRLQILLDQASHLYFEPHRNTLQRPQKHQEDAQTIPLQGQKCKRNVHRLPPPQSQTNTSNRNPLHDHKTCQSHQ